MYCLAQPSVFSHIVLNDAVNTFLSLGNEIKRLLCVVAVAASCLVSSDKKSETLHDVDVMVKLNLDFYMLMH